MTLILTYHTCFGQTINHKDINKIKIERTIINFLNWYKIDDQDTTKVSYAFIKGGYPDTTTKQRIDMDGVELYFTHLRKAGYFSESYINDLREYFRNIDNGLQAAPKLKDLVAIPGLDGTWILKTFDSDMILDHIKKGRFDKIAVIYNKAIVRFRISKIVIMLFTMTRENNKWLIDYIGYDNTYSYSLGRE
jgi:hypothetical protein